MSHTHPPSLAPDVVLLQSPMHCHPHTPTNHRTNKKRPSIEGLLISRSFEVDGLLILSVWCKPENQKIVRRDPAKWSKILFQMGYSALDCVISRDSSSQRCTCSPFRQFGIIEHFTPFSGFTLTVYSYESVDSVQSHINWVLIHVP